MPRLYLLFLCLIASAAARAQGLPGYILTPAGDTVAGFVAEKKHQVIYLYPAAGGKPQVFRPAQVQGYGLLDRPAIRSRVVHQASGKDSVCFVLPVQLGRASLYCYAASEGGLLLQPAGLDTLYELTPVTRSLLFNRYLVGCATLVPYSEEMLEMRFSAENVEKVLRRYNRCLDPTWQPTAVRKHSPWRHGLGLHAEALRGSLTDDNAWAERTITTAGWGQRIGLEWTAVRASGLQMGVVGTFTYLPISSPEYLVQTLTGQAETERRTSATAQLLTLAISAGRRLGRPTRPGFYVGAGAGSTVLLHEKGQTQQRPAGSTMPFQTTETYSVGGEAILPHLEAQAGVLAPIGPRHEIRLTGIYQKFVFTSFSTIGLRVAYVWFRK